MTKKKIVSGVAGEFQKSKKLDNFIKYIHRIDYGAALRVSNEILDVLSNRKGFDAIIDELDEETAEDIKHEIAETIIHGF